MNTNDKITLLEQVKELAAVNMLILTIAKKLAHGSDLERGQKLLKAGQMVLDACDILNQLGAEIEPAEANPTLN